MARSLARHASRSRRRRRAIGISKFVHSSFGASWTSCYGLDIYYSSLTLQNCARAGAMYASDPHVARESPFASADEAALADATNLSPLPTIHSTCGANHDAAPLSSWLPFPWP